MNLIAVAFIALGYSAFYWAANQIKHWNRSVTDTEAATFKLLMGFPMGTDYQTIHAIPFPFQPTTTGAPAASNGTSGSTGGTGGTGNGGLSPNYPGGSGTIPTPGIPGTPTIPGKGWVSA